MDITGEVEHQREVDVGEPLCSRLSATLVPPDAWEALLDASGARPAASRRLLPSSQQNPNLVTSWYLGFLELEVHGIPAKPREGCPFIGGRHP